MRFGGVAGAAYAAAASGSALFDTLAEAETYFGTRLKAYWRAGVSGRQFSGLSTTVGAQVPTTNGVAVGMILDARSITLGSEILLNASMATNSVWALNSTGWTHNGVDSYVANITTVGQYLYQNVFGDYNNNTYFGSIDYEMLATASPGGGNIYFNVGGSGQDQILYNTGSLTSGATGTVSGYSRLTAQHTAMTAKILMSGNYTMNFEARNASIKQYTRLTAYQQTSGSAPTYSTTTKPHFNYAGATKSNVGYFPTSLGSDATVVTLTVGGTVSVLASQTVSGAYSLPKNDWCICWVIEDPLTSGELTDLTAALIAEYAGM